MKAAHQNFSKDWRSALLAIAAHNRDTGEGIAITPAAQVVGFALGQWLDSRDRCGFRSVGKLERDTGFSDKTVEGALRVLQAVGLISAASKDKAKVSRYSEGKVGRPPRTWEFIIPEALNLGKHGSPNDAEDKEDNLGKRSSPNVGNLGKHGSPHLGKRTSPQYRSNQEGAGARSRAPQAQAAASVNTVVDKEDDFITDAHLERGPEAVEPPLAANAADTPNNAAEQYSGDPITLADLDAMAAEEARASEAQSDPAEDGDADAEWFSRVEIGGDPRGVALDAVVAANSAFSPVPSGMGDAVFAAKWTTAFALGGSDHDFRVLASEGAVAAFTKAGRLGGKAGAAEWWEGHRVALQDYAVVNGADAAAAADGADEYTRAIRHILSERKTHAN